MRAFGCCGAQSALTGGFRRNPNNQDVSHALPALRNPARAAFALRRICRRLGQAVHPSAVAFHPHPARAARGGQFRSAEPPGQRLRKAGVQHHHRAGGRPGGRGSAGAGGDRQTLLPPAALQTFHRRLASAGSDEAAGHRAGGGAAVGPPLHLAARHGEEPAAGSQGVRHRLDRRPHGAGGSRPRST